MAMRLCSAVKEPFMKAVLTIATAFMFSVGLSGQPKTTTPHQQAERFVGTWRITCEECPGSLLLELKFDGARIGGRMNTRAVQGHIESKGRRASVAFALPESWQAYQAQRLGAEDAKGIYMTVSFAELRDDGTLEGHSDSFVRGYGNTVIKTTNWTAQRVVVR
jgi:hypothetical protein